MTGHDRQRWNQRYRTTKYARAKPPNALLRRWTPPGSGQLALDLACGPGHNALWLAEQGYQVMGVDISRVALAWGTRAARARSLSERVCFVEADLDRFVIPAETFDLICVFRFLDRQLFPALSAGLGQNGVLIVETLDQRWLETHPGTTDHFLVGEDELQRLVSGLEIRAVGQTEWSTFVVASRL
jgi:SAM-dependent methyltransferase